MQMVDHHQPHHYARSKAGDNRGLTSVTAPVQDGDLETRTRMPTTDDHFVKRQDWNNMDLSGQGLRVLATPLFKYDFLCELYIASNKITQLPTAIGQLRHLKLLDASNNQLTQLPVELGMCVYLKNLLLFDNNIQTLPVELGSLYQLEMLGIEGNPLDTATREEIMQSGTKAVIHRLRESARGENDIIPCLSSD